MTTEPILTIRRLCAGGCGVYVYYSIDNFPQPWEPEIQSAGTSYRGGHLCRRCDATVDAALAARRSARTTARADRGRR